MWCLMCGVTQLENVFPIYKMCLKALKAQQAFQESLKEEKKIDLHFVFVVYFLSNRFIVFPLKSIFQNFVNVSKTGNIDKQSL